MDGTAFVSRIQIFPIKSLDATILEHARILPSGALQFDRTWALFDERALFVNGKRHAAIHRLRSLVDLDRRTLAIGEGASVTPTDPFLSLDSERDKIESRLGAYFGFPVELRSNEEVGFPDDLDSPGPTIISVATLREISRWFSLPFEQVRARFRTNIEVDGVPAFWEDQLFSEAGNNIVFDIGGARFEGVNPCQRCIVPTRDPVSGTADKLFAQRFMEQRRETLPVWSTRGRFNNFYRVAVNTRSSSSWETIRIGDVLRVVGSAAPDSSRPQESQSPLS